MTKAEFKELDEAYVNTYAEPRFNKRTGVMLKSQWNTWLKLQEKGWIYIQPDGDGEADSITLTPEGASALLEHKRKLR